jgi:hypothetical protein
LGHQCSQTPGRPNLHLVSSHATDMFKGRCRKVPYEPIWLYLGLVPHNPAIGTLYRHRQQHKRKSGDNQSEPEQRDKYSDPQSCRLSL